MKIFLSIILLFFIFNVAYCQRDSSYADYTKEEKLIYKQVKRINKICFTIDNNANAKTIYDSVVFTIDSIQVKKSYSLNKITSVNTFKKSGSELLISFYYEKNALKYVQVLEKSNYSIEAAHVTKFYFNNDTLIKVIESYRFGVGLLPNENINKIYGYNKYLTVDFLKEYILKLNEKLKP